MQRNVEKKKFLLEIIFFHREINDKTNKIFSYKKTRINIIAGIGLVMELLNLLSPSCN